MKTVYKIRRKKKKGKKPDESNKNDQTEALDRDIELNEGGEPDVTREHQEEGKIWKALADKKSQIRSLKDNKHWNPIKERYYQIKAANRVKEQERREKKLNGSFKTL